MAGFLTTIFSMFSGQIVDKIWSGIIQIVSNYQQKQLSEVEAKKALYTLIFNTFRDIEVTQSQELTKTFESFQTTLRGSAVLQAAWVALFVSQTVNLLWYQLGVPALCYTVGVKECYPTPGETIKWSYLILMFMLGAGPIVFRAGPAAGSLIERLRLTLGGK